MARNLTEDQIEQLTSEIVRPIYAVLIDLPDATSNSTITHAFWTGDFDDTIGADGQSYNFIGAGNLLSISEGSETSDLSANGLSISLLATTDIITVLRDKEYQGMQVRAFVGTILENYHVSNLTPTIFKFFDGFADQLLFSMSENSCIVTLKAENKLVRLSKSSGRYYTQEDQIAEYPDDKGFEYMNNLQDREVLWGRK